MGVVKPTLTLTANASSASTDAGPMSVALSLSATDSLAITKVESQIIDVTEFAFFPWDCTVDLNFDANGDTTNALESWVFVRTGTA